MGLLHEAARAGDVEQIYWLLDVNIDGINDEGLTPLQLAVSYGRVEAIRALLSCGASVDARSSSHHEGITALHCAAIRGDREIVELLLEHGASWEAVDAEGKTPADYARHHAEGEIEALLDETARRADEARGEDCAPVQQDPVRIVGLHGIGRLARGYMADGSEHPVLMVEVAVRPGDILMRDEGALPAGIVVRRWLGQHGGRLTDEERAFVETFVGEGPLSPTAERDTPGGHPLGD